MKNIVKISGFALIFVGTVGLLLNEFVLDAPSSCTISFAVVNFVGLVSTVSHTGTETRPRLLREAAARNFVQWAKA